MRTTKPISTISFNSAEYLEVKLGELQKAGRISFWAFITHQPEDDEGGKKVHHHVFVEPSKMLQTDDLREELKEFDPQNPQKPKGCLTWDSSRFDHWYMYALHDKRYLATKGQARRHHYSHDDFVSSDEDDLLCKSRRIDLLALSPYEDMIDAIEHGITFEEYFARGTVPIPQIRNFQIAYQSLMKDFTYRNKGKRHANDVYCDPETGEIIDENAPICPENAPICPENGLDEGTGDFMVYSGSDLPFD